VKIFLDILLNHYNLTSPIVQGENKKMMQATLQFVKGVL